MQRQTPVKLSVATRVVIGVNFAYQSLVANQLPGQPQEGLLEVVVALGGDVVVLEILLSVERDGLGLDLALLHIDLVAAQNDWDGFADTDEVTCRRS